MAENIEPVIRKSAGGGSIPLNTAGPLNITGADALKEADACHFVFREYKIFEALPSPGTPLATYDLFTLVPGTLVLEVNAVVLTAFTTSTTLTIGDGDEAAGYLASADIVPQTINTVSRSAAAGEALALGKYYPDGDTIDIVVGAAIPIVGKLLVELVYTEVHRFKAQPLS